MPDIAIILLAAVVIGALAFDFINGFHDAANAIATCILTRALSIRNAIFMAAGQNFIGAMIWTGVATTIGKGIVDPEMVKGVDGQLLVLAALMGAIIWTIITWLLSLPISCSHALIGGVIGAALTARGPEVLNVAGLTRIFSSLISSPILGFIAGIGLMILVMNIFANHAPSTLNRHFKWMQIASANFMAFTHGSNDAQKSMGIITMALFVGGFIGSVEVPLWVKITCAGSIAMGTAAGGWRIIKTVGKKIMGLQPVHGFASETAAAAVVLTATILHAPVSTTHVISSSIMGVGSAKRLSSVRWGVVGQIVLAWVTTLPVCAIFASLCYLLLKATIKY